jgi:hypothetical protein
MKLGKFIRLNILFANYVYSETFSNRIHGSINKPIMSSLRVVQQRFDSSQGYSSLIQRVQTESGGLPSLVSNGYGIMGQRRKGYHSSQSSAEDMNSGAKPPLQVRLYAVIYRPKPLKHCGNFCTGRFNIQKI